MPGYCYFILALFILIVGGYFYGKLAERLYDPDLTRPVPAIDLQDGVDYTPLPRWKIFLIQLLNIAGLGPIFGAILGAAYGPACLIWIVFGCVFGGAIHDYYSGMISLRRGGQNLPDLISRYMSPSLGKVMRILCIVMCALVGVVFVQGPAKVLEGMTSWDSLLWAVIIYLYYFLATILPIQTIIAKIYPIFGLILIYMAGGVLFALLGSDHTLLPNTDFFSNANPKQELWPMLFVTIACGALSGFHATQSPMMARCVKKLRWGRAVFHSPMITEGVITLIWATVGLSFYDSTADLMKAGNPAIVVNNVCRSLLGPQGAILAILGVVVLPITSGDTALRCARLILSDMLKWDQVKIWRRIVLAVPLFVACIILCNIDFSVIWRYFGWCNQLIATITLWMISFFFIRRQKFHWITTIPALFMTTMCLTYFFYDKYCCNLSLTFSTWLSIGITVIMLILFLCIKHPRISNLPYSERHKNDIPEEEMHF